jgi:hypothetical protein
LREVFFVGQTASLSSNKRARDVLLLFQFFKRFLVVSAETDLFSSSSHNLSQTERRLGLGSLNSGQEGDSSLLGAIVLVKSSFSSNHVLVDSLQFFEVVVRDLEKISVNQVLGGIGLLEGNENGLD